MTARPWILLGRCSVGATLLVALAACGTDGNDSAKFAVPNVFDLESDPAKGIADIDPTRGAVLTAEQLRNQLDQQLAWHGVTLVEVMRAARVDRDDMQVWIDQLTENTADLTATVGVAYGPVGARAFNQQWGQHTQFLVDYAVAVGQNDDKAADKAEEQLAMYAHDSGSFFSTATGGALNASLIETMLTTHVGHMLAMIDSEQAGDLAATVDAAVADSSYLGTISAGLSTAIAQQNQAAFPGSTDTPLAALCSIVTSGTSAYLSSLIITGDPTSSVVLNADQTIVKATNSSAAAIFGLGNGFDAVDSTSRAKQSRAALAAANAYVLAHPPAADAPVAAGALPTDTLTPETVPADTLPPETVPVATWPAETLPAPSGLHSTGTTVAPTGALSEVPPVP